MDLGQSKVKQNGGLDMAWVSEVIALKKRRLADCFVARRKFAKKIDYLSLAFTP